ncbi:MAG: cobalamin-dependent protein [Planctomycetota bacterium]
MSFKVLFIAPDFRPDLHIHNGSVFEGIGYLSAFLKLAGFEVEFFGPKNSAEAGRLISIVSTAKPQLIGFSSVSSSYKYVKEYAKQIKEQFPNIPTICGGVHPTIAPDEVIGNPHIDMIALGEAEHSLLHQVREGIPSLKSAIICFGMNIGFYIGILRTRFIFRCNQ